MTRDDCEWAATGRALLFESGELERGEKERFERHLSGCGECRELLVTVQASHGWAATASELPSAGARARAVLAHQGAETGTAFPAWTFAKPLAVSLALGAAVVGVYLSRPAAAPETWYGADAEIERVQERLDTLDAEMTLARLPGEFEDTLDDLKSRKAELDDAFAGGL